MMCGALGLGLALASANAGRRHLDSAGCLAHDFARARALDGYLASDLADALADARASYSNPALERAFARALDSALARALDIDLCSARALYRSRASDLAHALSTLDSTRALVLARDVDSARDLRSARALYRAYALDSAEGRVRPAARGVAPSAAGLLAAATRLLPAAHRSRYAEEYRCELWDIAQAGAGRARQLRYALRQFRSAVPMSIMLRSPRRRGSAL